MLKKTCLAFNEKMRLYDLGEGHPFRGNRFDDALNLFREQGLLSGRDVALFESKSATKKDLLRVHDDEYVDLIFRLALEGKPYDSETPVSREILEGAMFIVGGALDCGERAIEGKVGNCAALGGGHHHAGRNYGGGFCLFNDVAILVESLRSRFGLKRFLILDYDVHFGNGTSDIYYQDPTVLYISLHQDPRTLYPGTGFVHQIGKGKGEGYNVNVPLPPGTGDNTYLYALNEVFVPLAEEFKPNIIIANGGSDSHFADSLGNLALSINGFFRISSLVRETAAHVCTNRSVFLIGSGYNPEILPRCWYALLAGLAGLGSAEVADPCPPPEEPSEIRGRVERTLDELKRLLRKHWSCFGGFSINIMP